MLLHVSGKTSFILDLGVLATVVGSISWQTGTPQQGVSISALCFDTVAIFRSALLARYDRKV
jgi:hypothetical protein